MSLRDGGLAGRIIRLLDLNQVRNPKTLARMFRRYCKGEAREKHHHARSSSGGSRDAVRRSDFGSVVAREGHVGIVGHCLCPSRTTANCNERRWRRKENGTTGSAPLRGGRYLLLGFVALWHSS